jgi:hypothetical protein
VATAGPSDPFIGVALRTRVLNENDAASVEAVCLSVALRTSRVGLTTSRPGNFSIAERLLRFQCAKKGMSMSSELSLYELEAEQGELLPAREALAVLQVARARSVAIAAFGSAAASTATAQNAAGGFVAFNINASPATAVAINGFLY